jgi:hypothetical protein
MKKEKKRDKEIICMRKNMCMYKNNKVNTTHWVRLKACIIRLLRLINILWRLLCTVNFYQPSHEFIFGVGMNFISYPLVLTSYI